MKLRVYEDKPKVSEVFLQLDQDDDEIDLIAVDAAGNRICWLITIRPDGTCWRHTGVDSSLGFALDAVGRMKIDGKVD